MSCSLTMMNTHAGSCEDIAVRASRFNRKKTNQIEPSRTKHSSIIYGPSRMCMKMGQPL